MVRIIKPLIYYFSLIILALTFYSPAYCKSNTTHSLNDADLEMTRNIDGTLEIRLADFPDGALHNEINLVEYILIVNKTLAYTLHFTDTIPTHLKTGMRIRVKQGLLIKSSNLANELSVSGRDVSIIRDVVAKEMPHAFGIQKTLVMLVNFQNDASNQPWTIDNVKDIVFKNVSNMLNEFSYQQTTLIGDVVGWYTLPIDSTADCKQITNMLPFLAEEAAQQSGTNLSMYTRHIYLFPPTTSCPWSGLATLGGLTSRVWLNGINRPDVITHEIGHNLGLRHSHSLVCENSANQAQCDISEYGDTADTMGTSNYLYSGPHFNAYQKERLGWLNFAMSPPIQTVTSSGTYLIDAYETENTNTKALKILKENLADGSQDYYYVEFRTGAGFDSELAKCEDCNLTKGVLIHKANNSDPNSSTLINLAESGDKAKQAALLPGQSFKDPNTPQGGVVLTLNAISDSSATINVTFGNGPAPAPSPAPAQPPTPSEPVCTHTAPAISIAPSNQTVKQGRNAKYTITLTNNESGDCTPADFALSITNNNKNLNAQLTPMGTTLAPGVSATFTLKLITSKNTRRGNYNVVINATNTQDKNYSASVTANLKVKKDED